MFEGAAPQWGTQSVIGGIGISDIDLREVFNDGYYMLVVGENNGNRIHKICDLTSTEFNDGRLYVEPTCRALTKTTDNFRTDNGALLSLGNIKTVDCDTANVQIVDSRTRQVKRTLNLCDEVPKLNEMKNADNIAAIMLKIERPTGMTGNYLEETLQWEAKLLAIDTYTDPVTGRKEVLPQPSTHTVVSNNVPQTKNGQIIIVNSNRGEAAAPGQPTQLQVAISRVGYDNSIQRFRAVTNELARSGVIKILEISKEDEKKTGTATSTSTLSQEFFYTPAFRDESADKVYFSMEQGAGEDPADYTHVCGFAEDKWECSRVSS